MVQLRMRAEVQERVVAHEDVGETQVLMQEDKNKVTTYEEVLVMSIC